MGDNYIEEGTENRKSILKYYNHEIEQLDHVSHTTSGILYSCVLAVVHYFESEVNFKNESKCENMIHDKGMEISSISDIYLPSGDFIKISDIGSNSNFQSLLDSKDLDLFENSIITSEVDDYLRYSWAKSAFADHASLEGLKLFQNHALIRSQINTLLLGNKFQLKPEMTSTERGIKETEILSFTSLSTTDLYRNDQLQAFSEMLKSHVQILPNFTGALKSGDGEDGSILRRRYFRQIPAKTFAQILVTERMREPVVLKDYYTMTDDLLYVLHWPPPERRIKKSSWMKTVILTTPIVANASTTTTTTNDSKKIKKSAISKKKCKDNENKDYIEQTGILNYEVKTTTLTPAAHSIAIIKKTNLSVIPWLSIYINGSIIGLRIEDEIVSNLELDDAKSVETSNTMKSSLNGEIQDRSLSGDDESSVLNHLSEGRKGMFFCHTEDDVRFITCSGPMQSCKPDGFGTACLIASYTDKMIITICTNGITKILIPPVLATSSNDGAGIELERFVGIGGTVMSIFSKDGPSYNGVRFRKEIKESNGTRLLIRWQDDLEIDNNKSPQRTTLKLSYQSFYEELCSFAPVGWTCVKLAMDGSVTFYFCPTDCSLLNSSEGVSHSILNNKMKQTVIDAETKCLVTSFMDGRLIITYCDGRVESRFGDGTIMMTHSSGSLMTISKRFLPTIEIDTEIDAVSRQHARGVEVPINKGGDRVRSRIALPDGSAVFVKYNTLLTATSNGSIKLIRRDKTIILVSDSGVTTYLPRTAWNETAAAEFSKDCADLEVSSTKENDKMLNAKLAKTNDSVNFNTNNSITSSTALTTKNKTTRTTKKIKLSGNLKDSVNPILVEEDGVFVDKKEKDASITIDYTKYTCKILDHQYNSFDINLLENALDPLVTLSGEVDGLKPPAVADKPMDPRMFIVNRSADAMELLSIQNVTNVETLLKSSADVKKVLSKIELQPSDLGTSNQHQYFIQRRLLGNIGDNFTFEEVFGSRVWHPNLDHLPAAGIYFIRKSNQDITSSSVCHSAPRFYEKITLCERNPLSLEGHGVLRKAIKKCEEFRLARLQSIDRFKVDEDRSKEELDEEEALAKRLKLAFKTAKTMAAKKKEQKLKDNTAGDNSSVVSSIGGAAVGLNKHIQGITIIENLNEDAEDDDESASFFEDEVPEEILSTEELEIKETFQDFASQPNNNHEEAFYISKDILQDAYIRLFNRYITQDLIIKELDRIDDCDPNFKEFTFIEFRNIYYSIKANLLANQNHQFSSSDFNLVTTTHNTTSVQENDDDVESLMSYNSEDHSHSPTYWQSTPGKSAIMLLPAIGPSLDFRKLKWEGDSDIKLETTEEIQPLMNDRMINTAIGYPVGSAFQVVRNRAFTAPE